MGKFAFDISAADFRKAVEQYGQPVNVDIFNSAVDLHLDFDTETLVATFSDWCGHQVEVCLATICADYLDIFSIAKQINKQ